MKDKIRIINAKEKYATSYKCKYALAVCQDGIHAGEIHLKRAQN